MIIKMAFRNLFRHKKRTMLTMITMIVGILLSVVADGTYGGMEQQVTKTYIETDIGLYKLYAKDYYEERYDNEKLEYLIDNETEVKLDKVLTKYQYAKRLVFEGKVINESDELNATFIGSHIDNEKTIFNRQSYMVEGQFHYDKDTIVIGYQLAELLGLKLGDNITIMARTARKSIDAYDVTIGGLIKVGNPILDSTVVFLPLDFAKTFADTDYINDIVIDSLLDNETIDKLKGLNIDFVPYTLELQEYLDLAKADKISFLFIGIGILLMAGINIANTMLMAMLERRREMGVLMANGMSRKNILKLFLAEGTMAGLIGTGIGIALGSLIVLYYQRVGIPLSNMQDMMGTIPITDRLYMALNLDALVIIALIGLFFSLVAAYYPAHKATKLNPVEAIRD